MSIPIPRIRVTVKSVVIYDGLVRDALSLNVRHMAELFEHDHDPYLIVRTKRGTVFNGPVGNLLGEVQDSGEMFRLELMDGDTVIASDLYSYREMFPSR